MKRDARGGAQLPALPMSDRDHIQGPIDAPLMLLEYGDYECPYCGEAYPVVKELRSAWAIACVLLSAIFRWLIPIRTRNFVLNCSTRRNDEHAASRYGSSCQPPFSRLTSWKRLWIVLTVLLVVWGALRCWRLHDSEPRYQGKPVSYWLDKATGGGNPQAWQVLNQMGPDAVPYLLRTAKTNKGPPLSGLYV